MRFFGKNYQCWADFNMDISGLTVLTGASNHGKSALFRALRGLFRNEIPAEAVRNDQDEALMIGAEIDGHKIIARRGRKGSTKYTVDGLEYAKLAGGVPDPVKALNMGELTVGDFTIDPIFAPQHGKQFLLSERPLELNTLLGAFASTEKLESGKKEANRRIAEKNSEAKTLAEQIGRAEARKAELAKIYAEVSVAANHIHRLEGRARRLETLAVALRNVATIQQRRDALRAILDAFVIPSTDEAVRLQQVEKWWVVAVNSFRLGRIYNKVRDALESVSTLWSDTLPLNDRRKAAQDAVECKLRADGQAKVLDTKLSEVIAEAEEGVTAARTLQASINALQTAVLGRGNMEAFQETLSVLDEQLEKFRGEETELRAAIAEAEAAERARKAREEAGKVTCPKCGHKFHAGEC